MPLVIPDNSITHVVVTCQADKDVYESVSSLATEQLDLFKKQKGYISGAVLKSTESHTIVTYLQWKTRADHEACLKSPDWCQDDKSKEFMQLIESGKVKVKPEIYEVIAANKT